jgi:hypothetical protein
MKTLPPILNARKNEDQLLPISKDYPTIIHNNSNLSKMKEKIKFAEIMIEEGFSPSSNLSSFLKEEKSKMFVILDEYQARIDTVVNRIPLSIRYDKMYETKNIANTLDSKMDIYFQLKQKLEEVKYELETVEEKLRRFKLQNKHLSKTQFLTRIGFYFWVSPTKIKFPSELIQFKYSDKKYNIVLVFIESKLYMYPASIEKENLFTFDPEIFTTYDIVKSMMDDVTKKTIPTSITKLPFSFTNSTQITSPSASVSNTEAISTQNTEEDEDDCDDF